MIALAGFKFFFLFSARPKSIEDAIREMKEGNAEAYLGLTDSIVGMIKFYRFQSGTTEEVAIQKVSYLKKVTCSEYSCMAMIMHELLIAHDMHKKIIIPCIINFDQAKLILRRIELRDLYACSGRIRVPKMLSETGAGDQKHHNGHLWRAMQAMKLQPQGETIYDLLDHDAKQRIKINDIWIEVCDTL